MWTKDIRSEIHLRLVSDRENREIMWTSQLSICCKYGRDKKLPIYEVGIYKVANVSPNDPREI